MNVLNQQGLSFNDIKEIDSRFTYADPATKQIKALPTGLYRNLDHTANELFIYNLGTQIFHFVYDEQKKNASQFKLYDTAITEFYEGILKDPGHPKIAILKSYCQQFNSFFEKNDNVMAAFGQTVERFH